MYIKLLKSKTLNINDAHAVLERINLMLVWRKPQQEQNHLKIEKKRNVCMVEPNIQPNDLLGRSSATELR